MSASSFWRNRPRVSSQVLRNGPECLLATLWLGRQLRFQHRHTIISVCTECINHIMSESEWNQFWFIEGQALVKIGLLVTP
jgi:hypothetical protein